MRDRVGAELEGSGKHLTVIILARICVLLRSHRGRGLNQEAFDARRRAAPCMDA